MYVKSRSDRTLVGVKLATSSKNLNLLFFIYNKHILG